MIQARRPDIAVKDKELDHTWLIDSAVPGDERDKDREQEKVGRKCIKIWQVN